MKPAPPPLGERTNNPIHLVPPQLDVTQSRESVGQELTQRVVILAALLSAFVFIIALFLMASFTNFYGVAFIASKDGDRNLMADLTGENEGQQSYEASDYKPPEQSATAKDVRDRTKAAKAISEETRDVTGGNVIQSNPNEDAPKNDYANDTDGHLSLAPNLKTYPRIDPPPLNFPTPPGVDNSPDSEVELTELETINGFNPFVGEGNPYNSTVYIIDISASMEKDSKLARAKTSLLRGIDQLNPNQKFLVILFDQTFHLQPSTRTFVPATDRNKQSTRRWLNKIDYGSGTNPIPALNVAIIQQPERIVLLSDGEFDPYAVDQITQMNQNLRKPARIDCVGLMEQVIVLQEIARQNKGVYYQAW